MVLGRSIAAQALDPSVTLEPERPRVGQTVKIKIRIQPRQEVRLDDIVITLSCCRRDYVRKGDLWGGGWDWRWGWDWWQDTPLDKMLRGRWMWLYSDRYIYVNDDVPCSDSVHLPQGKVFAPGQEQLFEAELQVHPDGFPTDREGDLNVWWTLQVRFDIPNFPDAIVAREIPVDSRYGLGR